MSQELKIGLIGLDTSHVPAFTNLLNDPTADYAVPGGKVTAAFPAGSADFPLSIDRVEGFTQGIRDQYGVEIVDSPEAVAEQCDAILITSVDGRAHRELFAKVAPFGKPTFIDKPFAVSSEDARAIAELARRHSVALASSSSLRFTTPVIEALQEVSRADILGVDVCGPMDMQPTQNGVFWYGIHTAEILFASMGTGCVQVQAARSESHEFIVGVWRDGRIGTVRGDHAAQMDFGLTLHLAGSSRFTAPYNHPKPPYATLLERLIPFFNGEEAPVPLEETLEIIRFLEAANESKAAGAPVSM